MYSTFRKTIEQVYNLVKPICELRRLGNGIRFYHKFFMDFLYYRRLLGAEISWSWNLQPELAERTSSTSFDPHYIYLNAWAFHLIIESHVTEHIDVGSQIGFVSLLASLVHVTFIDIRPIKIGIQNLRSLKGSILSMPFGDREIQSLSCLHVLEHIGLGRYGDVLDPLGPRKAIRELSRVLTEGGKLYLGLPVGKPRVCFNAHRVFDPETIAEWFKEEKLQLKLFAAVDDQGQFVDNIKPFDVKNNAYACGMYLFIKVE